MKLRKTKLAEQLSNFSYEGSGGVADGLSEKFQSPFVRANRIVARLKHLDMNIYDIATLQSKKIAESSGYSEKWFPRLEGAILKMMRHAYVLYSSNTMMWPKIRFVVQTPGVLTKDRSFWFMAPHTGTEKKYAKWTARMIRTLVRVTRNKHYKSIRVVKAIEDVSNELVKWLETCSINEETLVLGKVVHLLLKLCMEPDPIRDVDLGTFLAHYRTILCVKEFGTYLEEDVGVNDNGLESDEKRVGFSDSSHCSHEVAGIMYAFSCAAIVWILCVADGPARDKRVLEVKIVFAEGNREYAIDNMVQFRALCNRINDGETGKVHFTACYDPSHIACGTTVGQHVSLPDIGEVCRKLLKKGWHGIQSSLLLGCKIPDVIKVGIEKMHDNPMCIDYGYSAFSDNANKPVFDEIRAFIGDVFDEHEEEIMTTSWARSFKECLGMVIAHIHLTGGAPARGTELQSLLWKNTFMSPRHVMLLGDELMIIPSYNKSKASDASGTRRISRYCPVEVAHVFKTFFAVVYPIFKVIFESMRAGKSGDILHLKARQDNIEWKVGNVLTLGLVEGNNFTTWIAGTWMREALLFNFSSYRQHFCGLAKQLANSKRAGIYARSLLVENNFDVIENMCDFVDEKLVFQAGHSVAMANQHYALSVNRDGIINLDDFMGENELYRKAARLVHIILNISGDGKKDNRLKLMEAGIIEDNRRDNDMNDLKEEISTLKGVVQDLTRIISSGNGLACSGTRGVENMEKTPLSRVRKFLHTPSPQNTGNVIMEKEVASQSGGNDLNPRTLAYSPDNNAGPSNSRDQKITEMEKAASRISTPVKSVENKSVEVKEVPSTSFYNGPGASASNVRKGSETFPLSVTNKRRQTLLTLMNQPVYEKDVTRNVDRDFPKIIGVGAVWASVEQGEAAIVIGMRKFDVFVNLGTGRGKTVTVLSAIRSELGVTVWISPLRSLTTDMKRRMEKLGVRILEEKNLMRTCREKDTNNVFLITPEMCLSPKIVSMIRLMKAKGLLRRFVIDEAHLIMLSMDFRPCMARLGFVIGEAGSKQQIVMLTATCPDRLVQNIAEACGSNLRGLPIIRGECVRHNIQIDVEHLTSSDMKHMLNRLEYHLKTFGYSVGLHDRRCVVYCNTRSQVNELITHFNVLKTGKCEDWKNYIFYSMHGGLSKDTRERTIEQWNMYRNGAHVLIGTSAIGCGLDNPNVVLVIHAGGARSLIDYWQEAGRAGRNGQSAKSTVLFHKDYQNQFCNDG